MQRMRHRERTSSWVRAAKLALARALYALIVVMLATASVVLVSALTASSITEQECHPSSGLKDCAALLDMFDLDSPVTLVPIDWRARPTEGSAP